MDVDSDTSEPVVKRIKSVDCVSAIADEYQGTEKQAKVVDDSKNDGSTNVASPKDFVLHENVELTDDDDETSPCHADDDDDLYSFPPDVDIANMLDGAEYRGAFPTITDRYFTAYYKLNVQSPADDMRILIHSNRVCMLTLAPSHAVLQNGREITKVSFKVSDKLDRALNKVSGKGKHGAQPLQTNSNICIISCSNGETYVVKCCMIGKLVEVNDTLLHSPELLLRPPHKGGYLAIILPNIKLLDKMKESLLTQEQYNSAIIERTSGSGPNKSDAFQTSDGKECETKENHASNVSLTKHLETVENGSQLTSRSEQMPFTVAS